MSRPALSFLRPYLYQSARALRPEHVRAYLSVQRRFAQSVAADDYTGPRDVEKQKRLEQLRRVKSLDHYHPRLHHSPDVESLSIRDFNAKYEGIQETKPDVVSVMGMYNLRVLRLGSDSFRKGSLSASTQFQTSVSRY
jgi:lysyl-tRNA synthetase class 2